jgi:hypothetical protein
VGILFGYYDPLIDPILDTRWRDEKDFVFSAFFVKRHDKGVEFYPRTIGVVSHSEVGSVRIEPPFLVGKVANYTLVDTGIRTGESFSVELFEKDFVGIG